jgi:ABC-type glycerol-3-phosphate transport system substrate-binding protein
VYFALAAAITLLSILISACSGGAPAGASATPSPATSETPGHVSGAASKMAATQTSEAGQVTVAVTWSGLAAGPVFNVALD